MSGLEPEVSALPGPPLQSAVVIQICRSSLVGWSV
jgi:hypothetical protein